MKRPLSLVTLIVVALLLFLPQVWASPDGGANTPEDLQAVLYALVIMVIVTTMVTPPLLKRAMEKPDKVAK